MVRPSDLPLGWTSFRSPLDCCVLIFLHAPLCCFRLHSASQLLFNPPSTVSYVRLSRRPAPRAFRCEPEHLQIFSCFLHTLRCQIMFFHLHHHDISFDTIATHLGTVFALAPRNRHDLQVRSGVPKNVHGPDVGQDRIIFKWLKRTNSRTSSLQGSTKQRQQTCRTLLGNLKSPTQACSYHGGGAPQK